MDQREGAGRRQAGQGVSRQGAPRSWEAWGKGQAKMEASLLAAHSLCPAKGTQSWQVPPGCRPFLTPFPQPQSWHGVPFAGSPFLPPWPRLSPLPQLLQGSHLPPQTQYPYSCLLDLCTLLRIPSLLSPHLGLSNLATVSFSPVSEKMSPNALLLPPREAPRPRAHPLTGLLAHSGPRC